MTDRPLTSEKESRVLVVQEPGMVPILKYPTEDFDAYLDFVRAAYPLAEILILNFNGARPVVGSLHVELASEYFDMREAMRPKRRRARKSAWALRRSILAKKANPRAYD